MKPSQYNYLRKYHIGRLAKGATRRISSNPQDLARFAADAAAAGIEYRELNIRDLPGVRRWRIYSEGFGRHLDEFRRAVLASPEALEKIFGGLPILVYSQGAGFWANEHIDAVVWWRNHMTPETLAQLENRHEQKYHAASKRGDQARAYATEIKARRREEARARGAARAAAKAAAKQPAAPAVVVLTVAVSPTPVPVVNPTPVKKATPKVKAKPLPSADKPTGLAARMQARRQK